MRPDDRKVFDCFMFFNELDLLEIRLHELKDEVDCFLLIEAKQTHQGKDKPLFYQDNVGRFAEFENMIHHVVLDLSGFSASDNHGRESLGRRLMMLLASCLYVDEPRVVRSHNPGGVYAKPDDIIGIFDADEIPRKGTYLRYCPDDGTMSTRMRHFYYYLNTAQMYDNGDGWWEAGYITTLQHAWQRFSLNAHSPRNNQWRDGVMEDSGWHFSYLGGVAAIQTKLLAFLHQEYSGLAQTPETIRDRMREGHDLFDRPGGWFEVIPLDDTFPELVNAQPSRWGSYMRGSKDDPLET